MMLKSEGTIYRKHGLQILPTTKTMSQRGTFFWYPRPTSICANDMLPVCGFPAYIRTTHELEFGVAYLSQF